ncbi:hypothetical protein AVEN_274319-1 [Araneus ventricosus]|uniref:Reverse transcriptase RNase H-like domain-containing protein n=1 Tax=Araneus ventricosus TaxID=182803 RepID=A0A4Y2UAB3_ARAVE|nr:hypothetical protein AVEN_274319-1 [Araneus ventricosus]
MWLASRRLPTPDLDGQFFTIETDHNPLVWLKSNAGSNPRLMRWSLELQPFQYKVIHKAGFNHSNADALSRSETRTKILRALRILTLKTMDDLPVDRSSPIPVEMPTLNMVGRKRLQD